MTNSAKESAENEIQALEDDQLDTVVGGWGGCHKRWGGGGPHHNGGGQQHGGRNQAKAQPQNQQPQQPQQPQPAPQLFSFDNIFR